VFNVCHSQIEGSNGECYSCLLQAIFETIGQSSQRITHTDASNIINRAKGVLEENKKFLFNISSDSIESQKPSWKRDALSSSERHRNEIIIDSSDDEVTGVISGGNTSSSSSKREATIPTTFFRS